MRSCFTFFKTKVKFFYVLRGQSHLAILVVRKRWAGHVARIGDRRDS